MNETAASYIGKWKTHYGYKSDYLLKSTASWVASG
jgi:hypothetical protein